MLESKHKISFKLYKIVTTQWENRPQNMRIKPAGSRHSSRYKEEQVDIWDSK